MDFDRLREEWLMHAVTSLFNAHDCLQNATVSFHAAHFESLPKATKHLDVAQANIRELIAFLAQEST